MSGGKKRRSAATSEREPLAGVHAFAHRYPWLLEGLLFAVLALVLTWPLARNLSQAIPFGSEPNATVPLASLWALWWNSDRVLHLYQGYWDAPIFHPTAGAFGLTEFLPLVGLLAAPLWWFSDNPTLAYNLALLSALVVNGWMASRLLSALGLALLPALAGGAMVELLPFIAQELGVLPLVPLGGILWTLLAFVRLEREPRVKHGLTLGLAFAVTYLLCAQYALFLSLVLILCGGFLAHRRLRERRFWTAVGAGGGLCVVLLLPALSGQLQARLG